MKNVLLFLKTKALWLGVILNFLAASSALPAVVIQNTKPVNATKPYLSVDPATKKAVMSTTPFLWEKEPKAGTNLFRLSCIINGTKMYLSSQDSINAIVALDPTGQATWIYESNKLILWTYLDLYLKEDGQLNFATPSPGRNAWTITSDTAFFTAARGAIDGKNAITANPDYLSIAPTDKPQIYQNAFNAAATVPPGVQIMSIFHTPTLKYLALDATGKNITLSDRPFSWGVESSIRSFQVYFFCWLNRKKMYLSSNANNVILTSNKPMYAWHFNVDSPPQGLCTTAGLSCLIFKDNRFYLVFYTGNTSIWQFSRLPSPISTITTTN